MTLRVQQVNPAGTRVYMGTLTDNADIHESLRTVAQEHAIQTATVEMLGGLHTAELTGYDFVRQERAAPVFYERALYIVGGHGTIALLDDQPHVHLHLVVAYHDDAGQLQVVGGHVSRARAYAVEFTLTAYDGAPVRRSLHAGTGLQLWDLPVMPSE